MDFQSFVWYIVHFHICCSLDISGTILDISGTIDRQTQKRDRVKYRCELPTTYQVTNNVVGFC